jgi:hypothetical protein
MAWDLAIESLDEPLDLLRNLPSAGSRKRCNRAFGDRRPSRAGRDQTFRGTPDKLGTMKEGEGPHQLSSVRCQDLSGS